MTGDDARQTKPAPEWAEEVFETVRAVGRRRGMFGSPRQGYGADGTPFEEVEHGRRGPYRR